jgi:type II secretory pathway component PulF
MNAEDLIALNEEIAGMARAGLPLDQGLAALAREMGRGRLQRVTAQLADDLKGGCTLPEALERQSGHVPPYYAALVTAGIRSGRISEVLATLTVYARSVADLRSTIVGAVFYPAVVLVFAIALFGFLCFFIIPRFEQIFQDFNMRLPVVTEIAFAIGGRPLEVVVLPLVVVIGGVLMLRLILKRSERGRLAWSRLVYSLPVAGTLLRASRLAAFSELLAILVDHAVPLPEAFRLAAQASSDPPLAAASRGVEQDLGLGQTLAEVLRQRRLVPELIIWMMGVGELRGTLAQMLHQIAEVYRRQAELRATLLRSLLPPLLVIATAGLLVGFFVMSIMLPMIKLVEGLSK